MKNIKSWGLTFAFIAVTAITLERSYKKIAEEKQTLQRKLDILISTKETLLLQKHDLIQEINSQSDPQWIELMLMEELGLKPEGYVKFFFTE